MTPEERARKEIDRRLGEAGWTVQDYTEMNIRATVGVAVREFPLRRGHGTVDYMLYANAKAVGSVEAKPEGHTLRGVETQSGKYAAGLKDSTAAYGPEILFGYESTGAITQFTNTLEPDARSREVFQFHRPEELVRLTRARRQIPT